LTRCVPIERTLKIDKMKTATQLKVLDLKKQRRDLVTEKGLGERTDAFNVAVAYIDVEIEKLTTNYFGV